MQVRLEKYEAKPAFPVTPFAAFVQGGEEGLFMRSEPPAGLFSFASNGTFFFRPSSFQRGNTVNFGKRT